LFCDSTNNQGRSCEEDIVECDVVVIEDTLATETIRETEEKLWNREYKVLVKEI